MFQKPYIQSLILSVGLLIILLLGSIFFKGTTVLGINLQKFDLLSNIKKETTQKIIKPNISAEEKNSCPKGVICFENYNSKTNALDSIFYNFQKVKKLRIAFFGDSFTDSDILVGKFRDTLQQLYGGKGIGYIPMMSESPGFRKTIIHQVQNWNMHDAVHDQRDHDLGLDGKSFGLGQNNTVQFSATSLYPNTQGFTDFKFYYHSTEPLRVELYLNDAKQLIDLVPAKTINNYHYLSPSPINKAKIRVLNNSGAPKFYGCYMTSSNGIQVDNYALKGNSGLALQHFKPENLAYLTKENPYDVIILQYGLNVISDRESNYKNYKKGFIRTIKLLRTYYPKTAIILMGISDKSSKVNGSYKTSPVLANFINLQREIAKEEKIYFWDTFQAMGGFESMPNFVAKNWAAKDYTHLTHKGGDILGAKLAQAFINEAVKYKKRHEKKNL